MGLSNQIGFSASKAVARNWPEFNGNKVGAPIVIGTTSLLDQVILSPTRSIAFCKGSTNLECQLFNLSSDIDTPLATLDLGESDSNGVIRDIDGRFVMIFSEQAAKAWIVDTNGDSLSIVGSANTVSDIDSSVAVSEYTSAGTFLVIFRNTTSEDLDRQIWTPNTGTGVITGTSGGTEIAGGANVDSPHIDHIIDMGDDRHVLLWANDSTEYIRVLDEAGVIIGSDLAPTMASPTFAADADGKLLLNSTDAAEIYTIDGSGVTEDDADTPTLDNRPIHYLETINSVKYYLQLNAASDQIIIKILSYDGADWATVKTVNIDASGADGITTARVNVIQSISATELLAGITVGGDAAIFKIKLR